MITTIRVMIIRIIKTIMIIKMTRRKTTGKKKQIRKKMIQTIRINRKRQIKKIINPMTSRQMTVEETYIRNHGINSEDAGKILNSLHFLI